MATKLIFLLCTFIPIVLADVDKEISDAKSWLQTKIPNLDKKLLPTGDEYTNQLEHLLQHMLMNKTIEKWFEDDRREEGLIGPINTNNFKCSLKPSRTTPTSVHKLRPADVKVIGAIGDSLTAGNGILASWVFGLLVQYRGHSFSSGGVDNLGYHVTLPNILKQGQQDLYGYSTGPGSYLSRNAVLNMAVPGSKASNMPEQARRLVQKMKKVKEIDFENDWKIVTLFVGGNDICDFCKDREAHSLAMYKKHLIDALDILHKDLPRTFVNILEVLDVSLVNELKNGAIQCRLLLEYFLCSCATSRAGTDTHREVLEFQRGYQFVVREIAESGRYDTKEDFTVVNQPFFRNSKPQRNPDGQYDLSLFGPDCFHLSKIGHSYAGKTLWNNMLQPVGQKVTEWSLNGFFECPTEERPYFATMKNSFL